MDDLDQEVLNEFVQEARESLSAVERDLLTLDNASGDPDPEVVNRIFRAVHSVKGGAGFFGMESIGSLSHAMEGLLTRVRDGDLGLVSATIDGLLRANDRLQAMVDDSEHADEVDISPDLARLRDLLTPQEDGTAQAQTGASSDPGEAQADSVEPKGSGEEDADLVSPEDRQEALSHGYNLYLLRVRLGIDVEHAGKSLDEYLALLGELGHVFRARATVNPTAALETALEDELEITVLVGSVLGHELASFGFELPDDQIRRIDTRASERSAPTPAAPAELTPEEDPPPAPIETEPIAPDDPGASIVPITPIAPTDDKGAGTLPPNATDSVVTRSFVQKAIAADETVRVKTSVLDALMELTGELVLARNRLMRALGKRMDSGDGLGSILHVIGSTTMDVQEQVMRTRLQPIGRLFNRMPRLVRDTNSKLGKDARLVIEGETVELDRTVLEGLSDPLTHLLRNSLDHGLETPDVRRRLGKPRSGTIQVAAYHEGGMVNIDVADDGKGIAVDQVKEKAINRGILTAEQAERLSDQEALNLVFAPGFSTAEAITSISGRGVGMDVVRTNIEKLGGTVELSSVPGRGTTVGLKLPLTLAIVPSLIVESEEQRFALPQAGLEEVLRLKTGMGSRGVERVRGADVLRHRGNLLPLVRLSVVLDLVPTYIDTSTGERHTDRRVRISDRRAPQDEQPPSCGGRRSGRERRVALANVQRVLVLRAGRNRFGLMIDRILDNEEIVVKPLPRYGRGCPCFSGTTILGDGMVAAILDPLGIVQQAGLQFNELADAVTAVAAEHDRKQFRELQTLLLVSNGTAETLAIPLSMVARVERVRIDDVEHVGMRQFLRYRGTPLPLVHLHDYMPINAPIEEPEEFFVVIPSWVRNPMGIVTTKVIDTVEVDLEIDRTNISGPGFLGSAILDERIVLVLDVPGLLDLVEPAPDGLETDVDDWSSEPRRILVTDDTAFFQTLIRNYLEGAGFEVEVASDGEEAWQRLADPSRPHPDLVVTDLAMPFLDGKGLLGRIRSTEHTARLPVIATGSATRDTDRRDALSLGFNDYVAKFDRDGLLKRARSVLSRHMELSG